jgi:signal transduction histidine kinase
MCHSHAAQPVTERRARPGKTNGHRPAIAADREYREESLLQRIAELEAHVEALDDFAHDVAHTLQTPLSHIILIAQLLEEGYCGALPDGNQQICRHLRAIMQNGLQMSATVEELLMLAAVNKMPVELVPLDMAGILAEAQERLALMIEESRAEISLPQAWPAASGYRPWVEVVWANYLSNAIKYGGRPPRLQLGAAALEEPQGMACFWVSDNGPGLTPEQQARLFTPFTRLDPQRAHGYGVGLSLVRKIVNRLGGQVSVESQVGRGSTFSFTLPLAAGNT